jgi:alcohol dehydrogenase
MRALVLTQHGGLENLQVVDDYPTPSATPGHVMIRVRASSFNHHDAFTVKGMPGIKVPLPIVPSASSDRTATRRTTSSPSCR